MLYQKPVKNAASPNDEDVDVLNKPIQSGTSGEVLIQPADAESNCIDGGNLVPWILDIFGFGFCMTMMYVSV